MESDHVHPVLQTGALPLSKDANTEKSLNFRLGFFSFVLVQGTEN